MKRRSFLKLIAATFAAPYIPLIKIERKIRQILSVRKTALEELGQFIVESLTKDMIEELDTFMNMVESEKPIGV